jgi:lipopolysaccharide export LptBFGC system permease protein LptF
MLMAPALAQGTKAGARGRGFLYGAAIVLAYYYIGRATELAARGGTFPAWLAAWVPNLVGLVVLALLLWRMPRSSR